MKHLYFATLSLGFLGFLGACGDNNDVKNASPNSASEVEVSPMSDVRAFHERIITLDSHLDTPALFHNDDYDFSAAGTWEQDGTHVDLPRMKEGGLDGGFWVIFTRQGPLDEGSYKASRNHALMRQTAIREMAAKYSDDVGLAFTAADAARLHNEGKRIVYQSMENSYPLGLDLSLLEHFYLGGLRMIAPVHWANNQFADSATDIEPDYDGLSPLGEALVREANRLGLVLDGSHAADSTVRDMMALSTTPIVLSHTGSSVIYGHPRNIDDALLLELKANGGVIQMNIFGNYLEQLTPSAERASALKVLEDTYGDNTAEMTPDQLQAWQTERTEINTTFPAPRSTYEKFMEHTFHVLDVIGPDHVGISGDWDGGGGVDGLQDIRFIPRITEDLLKAGYSQADVEKIWGGNLIRLIKAAEDAKAHNFASPDVLK